MLKKLKLILDLIKEEGLGMCEIALKYVFAKWRQKINECSHF